ncbi:MAG: hypothetical protein J6S67_19345, partial [Methanobrevibacter sp.]|nr:hypothetical protein [Methanobrevibacter sp.]
MHKKFGRYTVNATKGIKRERSDGLIETQTTIMGNIEIGLQIDPMTWRGDWLRDFMFGKDAAKYRLLNVENQTIDVRINGVPTERNLVTA